MPSALIYDPAYHRHETGAHPENAGRLDAIMKALRSDTELWKRLELVPPTPASDSDISRCHDPALIEKIRKLCESGAPYVDVDTRISKESFNVAVLAAGAATTAVDYVMKGDSRCAFSVIRPPGHHATVRQAMGFCLFNNAAIAARYAQAKHGAERILIVDWDVHHGNGTQEIFYADDTVFFFSTHQFPYYPGTGAASERGTGKGDGFTLNVPLPARTSASAHRTAFTAALKEIEGRFHPDLIIVSAGFDSRFDDPLGGLMLMDSDFAEMTDEIQRLATKHGNGRVIGLLEGGYNPDLLGGSVRGHVRALAGL